MRKPTARMLPHQPGAPLADMAQADGTAADTAGLAAALAAERHVTLELHPGDLVLLYSDGLIERRHRSLDEGLAALTAAAAGITDPENMISAVLDALGTTDTEDDTCLVALRVS